MYLRIREACKSKGWTLADLAEVSGISERSIEWYAEQKRQPQLERVERLAEVLEVSPAWLVSWE